MDAIGKRNLDRLLADSGEPNLQQPKPDDTSTGGP